MSTTRVFGPAYLDRVIRVDRSLLERGIVDGSFDGRSIPDPSGPKIRDEAGNEIVIDGLGNEGPSALGRVELTGRLGDDAIPWTRTVRAVSESFDLGGMGAGFAAAFGGELVSALGPAGDPMGAEVTRLLGQHGIAHRPIRIEDRASDWTLIVSSGAFGDKLAVGFRGCHAAVRSLGPYLGGACDLVAIAGLPNRLATEALDVPATVRFFAPAMRNMIDREWPLASLIGRFDVLSCNRREWEARCRGEIDTLAKTWIVAVTDGPAGCRIHFRGTPGDSEVVELPAFPRDAPPRDTNRAGEAFAATLVTSLLDAGWLPGPSDRATITRVAERASAAAALVLDMEEFGFPTSDAIDRAVRSGRVVRAGSREP